MMCDTSYTLPTVTFVGGATQDLYFYTYFYADKRPMDMTACQCNFAVVDYINRSGAPVISKTMDILSGKEGVENTLSVTLDAKDTVSMRGKYIYQITIKDPDGDTEIPNQGLMYVTDNINKKFLE